MGYPPFSCLALVRIDAPDEETARVAAAREALDRQVRAAIDIDPVSMS